MKSQSRSSYNLSTKANVNIPAISIQQFLCQLIDKTSSNYNVACFMSLLSYFPQWANAVMDNDTIATCFMSLCSVTISNNYDDDTDNNNNNNNKTKTLQSDLADTLVMNNYVDVNDGSAKHDETAIFYACRHANVPMMKQLMNYGANMQHKSKEGNNLLMQACSMSKYDEEVMELLLSSEIGLDVNDENK